MPETLMALDFGHKRIGIATGQTLTCTASPLTTLNAIRGEPDWHTLDTLVRQWRPGAIIVGLPIDTHGYETAITTAARNFGEQVASRYGRTVHFMHEGYSTREARWRLRAAEARDAGHRRVDALAAAIILESWMNNAG